MEAEAIAALISQGFAAGSLPTPRRALDMRYHGQEHTVLVPIADATALEQEALTAAFHERHRRQYTFALEDTPVEIVNLKITASASIARALQLARPLSPTGADPGKGTRPVHFGEGHGDAWPTPVFARDRLPAGFILRWIR